MSALTGHKVRLSSSVLKGVFGDMNLGQLCRPIFFIAPEIYHFEENYISVGGGGSELLNPVDILFKNFKMTELTPTDKSKKDME